MSDEWLYYPCRMGEHYAFVFYDHGIRQTIDQIAPPQLLRIRLTFKHPRPNGFPASEESPGLNTLEEQLKDLASERAAIYVGQFSVAGARQFHVYTRDSSDTWSSKLQELGQRHGYELEFSVRPDENREGYWKDLYPTDDQWHIIEDLRVIKALQEEGDNAEARRRVEHWVYFSSDAAAERFSQWGMESGYSLEAGDRAENGRYSVHLFHESTMHWQDITSHTTAVRRKAAEFGGDYDGWETEVCKR